MKHLTAPRMDHCIGCQLCALACARVLYNKVGWNSSGIRIQGNQSSSGIVSYSAHYCLACDPPPCAQICPTGALIPQDSGGVQFTAHLCSECRKCQEACPVDAIHRDTQGNIYLCIHCGKCVEYCPQRCLEMQDIAEK